MNNHFHFAIQVDVRRQKFLINYKPQTETKNVYVNK